MRPKDASEIGKTRHCSAKGSQCNAVQMQQMRGRADKRQLPAVQTAETSLQRMPQEYGQKKGQDKNIEAKQLGGCRSDKA
jgi:hypothetical protein